MKTRSTSLLVATCVVFAGAANVSAQAFEEETVRLSGQVLKEVMAIPAKGIPEHLLADAQGIVIVPAMFKGGFIVGGQHGRGVVLSRDDAGNWKTPTFVTVSGASVGWQVGVQSTDVIMVIRNRRGVEGLLRGKFTVGIDAAVAAGPVGRQAAAATDAQLKAEILSYSRSRGLFVGVALDGAVVQVDRRGNNDYYAVKPGEAPAIPQSAFQLMEQVRYYAGPANKAAPVAVPLDAKGEPELRRQLADASRRLQGILDIAWQKHLALPAEVYDGVNPPSRDLIGQAVGRYRAVANDPRYRTLTDRPEFHDTLALLVRYQNALQPAQSPGSIPLPPPPPQ